MSPRRCGNWRLSVTTAFRPVRLSRSDKGAVARAGRVTVPACRPCPPQPPSRRATCSPAPSARVGSSVCTPPACTSSADPAEPRLVALETADALGLPCALRLGLDRRDRPFAGVAVGRAGAGRRAAGSRSARWRCGSCAGGRRRWSGRSRAGRPGGRSWPGSCATYALRSTRAWTRTTCSAAGRGSPRRATTCWPAGCSRCTTTPAARPAAAGRRRRTGCDDRPVRHPARGGGGRARHPGRARAGRRARRPRRGRRRATEPSTGCCGSGTRPAPHSPTACCARGAREVDPAPRRRSAA